MKLAGSLLLISLGLAGCGHDLTAAIPDREPDVVTKTGISMYVEAADARVITPKQIDLVWGWVQFCLSMTAKPPTVLIVNNVDAVLLAHDIKPPREGLNGYARYDDNIVLIQSRPEDALRLWRHEFIHILLHQNGFDDDLNSNHEPKAL